MINRKTDRTTLQKKTTIDRKTDRTTLQKKTMIDRKTDRTTLQQHDRRTERQTGVQK